jgi:hypothetical protein
VRGTSEGRLAARARNQLQERTERAELYTEGDGHWASNIWIVKGGDARPCVQRHQTLCVSR